MPTITLPLDKGWMPDIPPFELPEGALSDTDQILPSILGYRGIDQSVGVNTTVSNALYALGAREFADVPYTVYWGNETSLNKIATSTPSAITNNSRTSYAASGTSIRLWQFEKYGDWILATNSYDPPQIMKTTTFNDLGGCPPSAKYFLVWGGRLILGNLGLAMSRGTTDTNVASSWFQYMISGVYYTKASVAAGTALAAGTIPQNKYGIYRFTIQTGGTITCTPAAANFTTGYNTEALAIAALPAVPAGEEEMGYITVMSTDASGFVGQTDALYGGSSGNPAEFTNYYIDTGIRSPKMLYWSALEAIEDWTTSSTTGCDRQDMPELRGAISGIQPITGAFSIFAKNTIRIGWLSRGVDVFNFTTVWNDSGADDYTTIPANGGVYFWSDRDVHFFDGQVSHDIGEGLRYTILGSVGIPTTIIPGTYRDLSVDFSPIFTVAHDPEEKLVYWNYTYGASLPGKNVLVVYSYKLQQFTKYINYNYFVDNTQVQSIYYSFGYRSIGLLRSDDGTSTIVRYLVNTAGTGGDLTTGEVSVRDESGNILTTIITSVRPRIHSYSTAITVTVSSRMNENDTPTTAVGTIPTTSFSGKADVRGFTRSGRYHKIKTTLSGGVCRSIDIEYEVVGKQ